MQQLYYAPYSAEPGIIRYLIHRRMSKSRNTLDFPVIPMVTL